MALKTRGAVRLLVDSIAGSGVGFPAASIPPADPLVQAIKCTVERAPIRFNTQGVVTADGSNGSPIRYPGAVFTVFGGSDMAGFRALPAVGYDYAYLMIEFQGTG
mgnify:CR=1 FL=1